MRKKSNIIMGALLGVIFGWMLIVPTCSIIVEQTKEEQ